MLVQFWGFRRQGACKERQRKIEEPGVCCLKAGFSRSIEVAGREIFFGSDRRPWLFVRFEVDNALGLSKSVVPSMVKEGWRNESRLKEGVQALSTLLI
ncbi:MAG: hypothetical protein CL912_20250 [Deltaproteobacteria bacterium]|nr:hypothetical protein [Deltaproteobacteria bacterium]